ncbi:substrate-binding periplasmic protein [Sinorhizobium americanum]|uniref:Polar amino acid transport system substrate-binding protein/arginine/ornithine transport system substrate-binding protein n=1 Tax=Sinorhizobium americanum TaxID=194963 RepID=A0A4V2RCC5_9HYPH|nr:transporter substrate-binding domain-containing protein [Sinorhizobium americanum]TCN20380.1 polar amino acid transport system substrate-binding protein/arginine/ornithine transport system substrate-binding protein [Sinorhizobium americanum]
MKSLRNYFHAATILLGCVVAGTPLRAETQKIVVGLDASAPPFVSVATDGKMVGFDIDVVNAVCAKLKAQCELQNIPWDGIFAALEGGKIDVIAGGINTTAERKQKYLMPGPYLRGPMAFLVSADSTIDGSPESLKGKTVGTQGGGSIYEKYVREQIGSETSIAIYDTVDASVLDLDAGRIDAVLNEELLLMPAYIMAKPGVYKLGENLKNPSAYTGEGKGMVVRKTDTGLAESLQNALGEMVASGELGKISVKWFGKDNSPR